MPWIMKYGRERSMMLKLKNSGQRDGENVPMFHLKESETRHGFLEEMVRIHEKVK